MDRKVYDVTLATLKVSAPGLSEIVRHGIARSIAMKLAQQQSTTCDDRQRLRVKNDHSLVGPVIHKSDLATTIEVATNKAITRTPEAFEPAPPALEMPKMLVLSTAHIAEETAGLLESDEAGVIRHEKGEYGWIIPVIGNPSGLNDPPVNMHDLVGIFALARANGCAWIMLDRDGGTVDDLPTYEW